MCVIAQTGFRKSRKLTFKLKSIGFPGVQRPLRKIKAMSFTRAQFAKPATLPFSYPTPSAPQPTILVVEDHDDTREMLCMLLEGWGFRAVEACNGLEAVEMASRERPQLIVMDGRLPLLDGLEATRRIRENVLLNHVNILAMNGSGSPEYHAEALAAGCDATIEKPFDIDALRTYVVEVTSTSLAHAASNTG